MNSPVGRPFWEYVADRVAADPEFARLCLEDAGRSLLNGEPSMAAAALREYVAGTIGFERLAAATGRSPDDVKRLLAPAERHRGDDLLAVFRVVREECGVGFDTCVLPESAFDEDGYPEGSPLRNAVAVTDERRVAVPA